MQTRRNERGLTLIELVVVIAVMLVAIPPLTSLYTEVASASVDETYQSAAVSLADSLMEEIVSKAFEDPDLSEGTFATEEGSRAAYDDIDDFDGLSNSPPQGIDGSDLDDYGGITRSVLVDNVTTTTPDPVTAETDGSTPLKRIKVKVVWTGGRGGELTLSTLRARLADEEEEGDQELIDETASAATAYSHNDDHFHIDLVSLASTDLEIESIELTANNSPPNFKEFKLDSHKIIKDLDVELPTGVVAVTDGSTSQRTIEAGDDPEARIKFKDDFDEGTTDVTLTLHFTDGSSDSISFSVTF